MSPELIPQTKNLVRKFKSFFETHSGLAETEYGHAARNLAWGVPGIEEELNEAQQKNIYMILLWN